MILSELKDYIKQHFGWPMVNVELHDDHLNNQIERAYKFHLKWGIGISTQETFFTKRLSAGVREYNMPNGVHSIVEVWDQSSNLGGSQELFSVTNAIHQQWTTGGYDSFSLVDYQLSKQYIDLLEKYQVSRYIFKYHEYNNTLLISPTPTPSGSSYSVYENQFALIKCFIEEGYRLDEDNQNPDWREYLYEDPWFQDYCIALCKIILGHTRRKLANMSSLGNVSISLDGDSLVAEGKEEKEALETELKESPWEGMAISYD